MTIADNFNENGIPIQFVVLKPIIEALRSVFTQQVLVQWCNCYLMTMKDMRLLGQALLGIYEDEFEGIHPATLQRYYGIDRRETIRHLNQTGAGHPNDKLENEEDGVIDCIEQNQANNVLHDAIEVPDGNTPFLNEEDENVFFGILDEVITEGIIPVGYNLQEGEDDYDENTTEHLRVGRRREIYVEVSLADPIWRTRSMLWAQAVSVLEHFEADVFF